MVDPIVRLATPADVTQLTELEREARQALVGQRGGDRWLELHPIREGDWNTVIAAGGVQAATIGDVVVGYLVAHVTGAIVYVDEVYVTPGARELGFGDGLLAAAIDAGREAGCTAVEGEALPGDRNVKNLYERAGITARLIVVARTI